MKKLVSLTLALIVAVGAFAAGPTRFVTVSGHDLVKPDGGKLYIRGTNLGNWLNPEGYMFGFGDTNCQRTINDLFCQMVGEEETARFWQEFKDNYITRADIEFIASTGANTIRLPFHYKLFTGRDYMGANNPDEGFARMDSTIAWCRDNGLYLILDMHVAPGGQTGDNIDDSYGYPYIFDSEAHQQLYAHIWKRIAERYKDEPVILGYELFNEPIAHYFSDKDVLNAKVEGVYKRGVKAIRSVDSNHIVLLGGTQWNGNFEPFTDWKFDDKIMYTCHRYGGGANRDAIGAIIAFRDRTGLPMYMGEIGHNTDEWQTQFVKTLEDANIGYTFWPYKKINDSCFMGFKAPDDWDMVQKFEKTDRSSFRKIRDGRPDPARVRRAMAQLIENVKAANCVPQTSYIRSIKLNAK